MKRPEYFTEMMGRLYNDDYGDPSETRRKMGRTVTFQITEDCNLRCSYCYQGAKTGRKMTLETGKRIVDMILEEDEKTRDYMPFRECAGVALDFIGGEPLLEVELIDGIMDYFVERAFELEHPLATRYMISISSNGTLYFTEKVQRFLKKWSKHLSFGVSVDGSKRLHDACRVFPNGAGSYDVALAAALDYGRRYGAMESKMTIAPGNVAYVYEAVSEMLNNGYKEINLNCVYEEGWTIDHAKVLYEQLKQVADRLIERNEEAFISMFDTWIGRPMPETDNQNWCGAGKMLAIDAAGNFYPCTRFAAYSLRSKPAWVIGNVREGIDQNRLRPFLTLDRTTQSPRECIDCEVASGCAWCQGENYDAAQTLTVYQRATAICLMHKARVRANNYYWNRLFRKLELQEYEEQRRRTVNTVC